MRFRLNLSVLVAMSQVCDQRPPVDSWQRPPAEAVDPDEEIPKAAAIPRDRLLVSRGGSKVEHTFKSLSSYRYHSEMADGFSYRNADLFPEMLVEIPATLQEPDEDFPFEEMTDCALIESSKLMVSCSADYWTEVLPDRFPDALHYLRIMQTKITKLNGTAFSRKDILVLEITGHIENPLEIEEDSFANLSEIQQLIIHDNNLNVSPADGLFSTYRHLVGLDVLDLDYNGLNFNWIDSNLEQDSDPVLDNLRHLSLRGNPIEKVGDYFFWQLKESPLKSLNLQSCNI